MRKKTVVMLVGVLMLLTVTGLAWLLIEHWPVYEAGAGNERTLVAETIRLFGWTIELTSDPERRVLILILIAGALGSFIHASTSFVDYVGNKAFVTSWLWWYVLRLPIGAAIALLFYLLLRGGLLAASAEPSDVSVFGFVGIGALAGMFSKQASDKLRELFDTVWNVASGAGDELRANKLNDSDPFIELLEPSEVKVGEAPVMVKVTGVRFPDDSRVFVGDEDRPTVVVGGSELEFSLIAKDTATAREIDVAVHGADGVVSNTVKLAVRK